MIAEYGIRGAVITHHIEGNCAFKCLKEWLVEVHKVYLVTTCDAEEIKAFTLC